MRSEQPHIDQDLELKKFRDHWHSTTKNATQRNWPSVYRNWIRRAEPSPRNNPHPARSTGDQKIDAWQVLGARLLDGVNEDQTAVPPRKELR